MSTRSIRIAVLASLVAIFLGLCASYWQYVMDDAYIAYRYSLNLAEGYGLVWNRGEDPVEGYTSFAWVVLHAAAIRAGLDPVHFSKVLSPLAGLLILGILVRSARSVSWPLVVVFAGLVAMSPGFAVLTMQGLETTATALIVLFLAVATERVARVPSGRHALGWHALGMCAALFRPDTIVFTAGSGMALLGGFALRRDGRALRTLVLAAIPFALAGFLYVGWRLRYFGYLFPNPYYVKMGSDHGVTLRDGLAGLPYVISFLGTVVLPYLLLGALVLWRAGGRARRTKGIVPIAFGCVLFVAYVARITAIQGAFWRFLFPVVPAALYLFLRLAPPGKRWSLGPIAAAVLVVFFLGWNLRVLPETWRYQIRSGTAARVEVGKALAGLDGKLFTSASGAVPFYSGWRTYDKLGLTSERIAHYGLSVEVLEEIRPDLILGKSAPDGLYLSAKIKHGIAKRYMTRVGGFVPVAAIRMGSGFRLYTFVRESSPHYDEIVSRLEGLETFEAPEPELRTELYRPEKIPPGSAPDG